MDVAIFKGRLDCDSPQLKLGGHDVRKRQEWDGGRAPLIIFALVEIDGHSFAGTAERDAAKAGLVTKSLEVEKLKVQIARLRHVTFGSSSERIAREIEQLELKLEELETEEAAAPAAEEAFAPNEPVASPDKPAKPRRTLPDHLPRRTDIHESASECGHCGGVMRKVGEDITEILEYIPGRFEVIRPKSNYDSTLSNREHSLCRDSHGLFQPTSPGGRLRS